MSRLPNHNTRMSWLPVDEPIIGLSYHVIWSWSTGCVWKCREIHKDKGTVTLETPKTKRRIEVKISDLRHIKSRQFKMERKLKSTP